MKAIALALAGIGIMAATLPVAAENAIGREPVTAGPAPTSNASPEVKSFVDQAAMVNMLEIDAAQAAKKNAKSSAYREYADMIVTDHTNMRHDLERIIVKLSGVTLPSKLDADDEQKLKRMESESGVQFERSYRQSQIDGHQKALKLFQDFVNGSSRDADLKSWAQASIPILQKHLQRAEDLPTGTEHVGAVTGGDGGRMVADSGARSTAAGATEATGSNASSRRTETTGKANGGSQSDAQSLVNEAVQMVNKMQGDRQVAELMKKAKGVYFVPDFGRGAVIVGARGGSGLVTLRENGKWSDPAFYDLGGISVGPQAGVSGGQVAFLLMSQKAVDVFKSANKFSLNAGAGLSIVDYSATSQASWGKGDVVMWSDTAGAYIGATISVTDIDWANDNNSQYYGQSVDFSKIMDGKVSNAGAAPLVAALPG